MTFQRTVRLFTYLSKPLGAVSVGKCREVAGLEPALVKPPMRAPLGSLSLNQAKCEGDLSNSRPLTTVITYSDGFFGCEVRVPLLELSLIYFFSPRLICFEPTTSLNSYLETQLLTLIRAQHKKSAIIA